MVKNPLIGCGYGEVLGDGNIWSLELLTIFGDGQECGYGDGNGRSRMYIFGGGTHCGDFDGDGHGNMNHENVYITTLIINEDPITTAYQAVTLQVRDITPVVTC